MASSVVGVPPPRPLLVLGGLYTGFFTPTEAGGVGAFRAKEGVGGALGDELGDVRPPAQALAARGACARPSAHFNSTRVGVAVRGGRSACAPACWKMWGWPPMA